MIRIDYGIAGRTALITGSSAGLGRACATALANAGVNLWLNSRTEETLRATAEQIASSTGVVVRYVVGDVTTSDGRRTVLSACGKPDILVNNATGPPPGDFRTFDETAWHDAVRVSMISPIMMIRSVIDGMTERGWGRIFNITSSAVKAPLPLLGLSNGARSGLTGFVAGLAREVAIHGVTINNLLPGRMQTNRLNNYIRKLAEAQNIEFDEAARRLVDLNPMKRFGRPEELGELCAFLASDLAAYITGQNFLIDGGEYPGL
jgi:3-oxoacyl-[acyl-carrier protein] reductase